jgi:sulfite reductase (NADPH) flavoprotein alpha-component
MGSILLLHTGEYFGFIGKIGMFLASLMMPLFTITGLMLYLRRNKKQ